VKYGVGEVPNVILPKVGERKSPTSGSFSSPSSFFAVPVNSGVAFKPAHELDAFDVDPAAQASFDFDLDGYDLAFGEFGELGKALEF